MTDATGSPPTGWTADLETLRTETERLVRTVEGLDETALRAPSLCAGWTRAHVVSHVSRNARAMLNLVRSAEGTPTPMYPSQQERDADIERGSAQSRDDLLTELRRTGQEIVDAVAGLSPQALTTTVSAGGRTLTGADLAWHRLREVAWHHVDLDAGYTFADAPSDAVHRWWDEVVADLRSDPDVPAMTLRTDERDVVAIGDGRPTVSGSRAGLLLWLVREVPTQVDAPSPDQLPRLTPTEDTK